MKSRKLRIEFQRSRADEYPHNNGGPYDAPAPSKRQRLYYDGNPSQNHGPSRSTSRGRDLRDVYHQPTTSSDHHSNYLPTNSSHLSSHPYRSNSHNSGSVSNYDNYANTRSASPWRNETTLNPSTTPTTVFLCDLLREIKPHLFARNQKFVADLAQNITVPVHTQVHQTLDQVQRLPDQVPQHMMQMNYQQVQQQPQQMRTSMSQMMSQPQQQQQPPQQVPPQNPYAQYDSRYVLPTPQIQQSPPVAVQPSSAAPAPAPAAVNASGPVETPFSGPVLRGDLLRNNKRRVAVTITPASGNTELLQTSTVFNIAHRSSWEDVAKKAVFGVAVFSPSSDAENDAFAEHVEYLSTKARAGVVSLPKCQVYLIPPEVQLFYQYAPPNLDHSKKQLLGLLTAPLTPQPSS